MRGRLVGAMGATSSVVGFGFGCEMCERCPRRHLCPINV